MGGRELAAEFGHGEKGENSNQAIRIKKIKREASLFPLLLHQGRPATPPGKVKGSVGAEESLRRCLKTKSAAA